MKRSTVLGIAAILTVAVGPVSIAQETDATIEEIVVTAQKREQNIQDVPASVSALSEEYLRERGLDNIQEYSNFVPGMVFSGTAFVGERSGPDITIRGVANSRLFDFETSIATATTGFVYGQMPVYAFDPRLMDVSRVEVLKGPQGTLYGAASMGGTVKVVPNRPNASGFSADFTVGLGYTNDGEGNHEASGAVNVPLIEDVLALRMSGFTLLDSGFIDARIVTGDPNEQRGGNSVVSGFDPNDLDVFDVEEPTRNVFENINEVETVGGQLALRFTPGERLDTTLSLFFQGRDEKSLPNFEPSLSSEINERTTELYILQPSSTDYAIGQLEIEYDLGFAELHSVTGALNRKFSNAIDFSAITYGALGGDGTVPVPGTAPVTFVADIDVFSQEIRLQGNADIGLGSGLDWTVGYFYQEEDRLATGSVPVSASWMENGAALGLLPPSGTRLVWGGRYTSDYENNSLFADLSFALTERLSASVGARRSDQELSSRRVDFGNVFAGAATPTGTTLDLRNIEEDQTTPRFTLSYGATENVNLYANASQGFRIGGGNPVGNLSTPGCQAALAVLGISDPGSFESDEVWNYEIGAKTRFADDRVRLNVTAFQVDWTDLQVSTSLSVFDPTCGASIVANVGEAELNGLELDLRALLADRFQLGVVAEFNDAELTESNPGVPGAQPGDPLKNVPDFSVAVGLEYEFAPFGATDGYVRLDYTYTDERSFSDVAAGPSEAFLLPSYDILSFRIGASYEDWEFVAYIDNITDESPHLGVTVLPGGPGIYADGSGVQRFVSTGRPRTAGVRISRSF